jgi:hypothetical protein
MQLAQMEAHEIDAMTLSIAQAVEGMGATDSNVQTALTWGHERLIACRATMNRSRQSRRPHDWAYGESVAIGVMLRILAGERP